MKNDLTTEDRNRDRLIAELDEPIPFGKHRGTAIKDLPPFYVNWLIEKAEHPWAYEFAEALEFSRTYVDEDALPEYELKEDQHQAADYIVDQLFNQNRTVARLQGGAGCVDADTEFLTPSGWRRIADYSGEQVLQWWPDGRTDFIATLGYTKAPAAELIHVKSNTVDMVISNDHRIPYITSKGNFSVKPFWAFGGKFDIPRYFNAPERDGVDLSDELIRVLIMHSADGYFDLRYHGLVFVNVKKPRKIARVRKLLGEAGIPFTENKSQPGYVRFRYYAPEPIAFKGLNVLWGCNPQQLVVAADEIPHWDGSVGIRNEDTPQMSFHGNKADVDFAQYAMCATSGRYGGITKDCREYVNGDIYMFCQSTRRISTVEFRRGASKKPYPTQDGFQYCFTTESGFWLARRNGKIFPTGNSGKSFTVQDIAIRARRAGYIVRAAATSYVATNNLAKDLEPLGVETKTIASLLRLDVVYNGPRETYLPGPDTYGVLEEILAHGQLLVIDEYSMVSDTIGQTLLDGAHQHGGKLLVVGDAWQLPSPDQNWDSLLCRVDPAAELWIPKRYREGSVLANLERNVRQAPLAFRPDPYLSDEVHQVRSIDGLFDAYCEQREAHPDEQHLVIYYKRAHMAAANGQIRRRLFGADAPDLCAGEQLRVQRTADYTPYYGGDGKRVYSGTTIIVDEAHTVSQSIHVVEADMHFQVPCWYVDGRFAHKPDTAVRCAVLFSVTENQCEPSSRGGAEFNHAVGLLTQWCKDNNSWGAYRAFRNCFVQVAYQYASTVHRVQGQSVDHVYTSPAAMRQADPYTAGKLMYVSHTRAKKSLTVL